jgi:hypothetical protein
MPIFRKSPGEFLARLVVPRRQRLYGPFSSLAPALDAAYAGESPAPGFRQWEFGERARPTPVRHWKRLQLVDVTVTDGAQTELHVFDCALDTRPSHFNVCGDIWQEEPHETSRLVSKFVLGHR